MRAKLGIAPIAWTNDDLPELGGETSLETCLSEARAAGYSGVETGGKFDPPFTVSLMKREGIQTFKSDAGTKREPNFVLCKETIRAPADLLRILAGVESGVFKALNRMTLEFQFMLYLGYRNGALDVPSMPAPDPATTEIQVASEAEETAADSSTAEIQHSTG